MSRKIKSCWMKRDDHPLKRKQCCCKCSFLIPDYSHPCVDGKSISQRKGWICTIDLDRPGGFSGWEHHSIGCEMFTDHKLHILQKKKYQKVVKAAEKVLKNTLIQKKKDLYIEQFFRFDQKSMKAMWELHNALIEMKR